MKPKHGGPLWAFQFCLQAYFPELREAANTADTEPLANAFARAPRKHNTSTFCYKFFYGLVERTESQFRVCLARPYPLFLAHDLSVIPDGETENDLKEIWGSFLVARDLHCGLSKAGVEGRRRLAARRGSHFLPTPKGDDLPHSDALVASSREGALKNADWDPLIPKAGKGKKASAVLPRPSTPAEAVPRVAAPPLVRAAIVTSTAAPTPRVPVVVGARKTLAHRTMPSAPPTRPIVAVAPGRKRDREASSTEAAAVEAAPAESVAVETAVLERSRKRVLLVLSEDEDEEEVPPVIGKAVAEEVTAAEVAVEGAAIAKVAEMPDAEAAVAEVPATEEAAVDMPDDEVLVVEPTRATLVEVPSAASAVPTLAVTASVEPLPSAPRRPSAR
ncbi:unnamed protein product [Prunus armeniaca]